ncbi:hypothetical protein ABZW02_17480 [Streptomyces sp. NPDC005180]|uniref:hypothetical protein n=1 Tax=Streptomyces sp. NPDC005180 TaxID=3156868 RepID=UPI0033B6E76E
MQVTTLPTIAGRPGGASGQGPWADRGGGAETAAGRAAGQYRIRRVETDLEGLTEDEREQIKDATRTLRKSRTASLGMPGIRPPKPDLRLERDA